MKRQLEIKLQEETAEYLESKDIEELADILEVVYALSEYKGSSKSSLEEIRVKKQSKNGAFSKRIFLTDITG